MQRLDRHRWKGGVDRWGRWMGRQTGEWVVGGEDEWMKMRKGEEEAQMFTHFPEVTHSSSAGLNPGSLTSDPILLITALHLTKSLALVTS